MIHSYKLGGYNIVLDVGSGAVHAVDDLAYDVINLYETKSADEIVSICLEKFATEGITEQRGISISARLFAPFTSPGYFS